MDTPPSPPEANARPTPAGWQVAALSELGRALSESHTLADLGQAVIAFVTQRLGYRQAVLCIPQKEGDALEPVAIRRHGDPPEKAAALPDITISPQQIAAGPLKASPGDGNGWLFRLFPDARHGLSTPLTMQGQVVGALGVVCADATPFGPQEAAFWGAMSALIAAAAANLQRARSQRRERRVADTLNQISAALVSSLELDHTLSLILSSLEQLLDFDSAAIYLLTPSDRLRMVAARGMPQVEVTMASSKEVERFRLDETVISSRKPLAVTDVRQDPRWTPLKGTEYIRSWLGVPLLARGNPIGLVTIDRSTIRPFTPSQITLAEAFARHAAIAIENARLFARVTAQQEQLRKLSIKVVEAQEEERRRISRELHDEMGQALTAIKLNLQMLLVSLPEEDSFLREQVEEVIGLTNDSIQEVRRLAMDLRPSILDDLGLVPTLQWYKSQFEKRNDCQLNLSIAPSLPRLTPHTETALYRVMQEALTNVSRHANARCVEISLSADETGAYCSIVDDGRGFSPGAENVSGVGLTSMQERIEALDGEFNLASRPGKGTTITIFIPASTAFNPEENDDSSFAGG